MGWTYTFHRGLNMFAFIKRLFSRDNQVTKRLLELEQAVLSMSQDKKQLEDEVQIYRQQDTEKALKYDSDEPWIEMTSDDYDPEKGLKVGLDWNKAFITHLRKSGITGVTEDDAIRKYIALLYQDILLGLEQQSIDNSDKKEKISDFA